MAITTTTALNSLYNQIYNRAITVAREMNLMLSLVSQFSANNFFTRNLVTRPALTVSTVSEGVDYANPETFGKTLVGTLTPQEKIGQVILTDISIMNDGENSVQQAGTELGMALATKIDTDLTSVFSSFATDVGPGAGATATLAKVAVGISVLTNRFAKQDGVINVVLHPYQWHDIWSELGQPAATKVLLGDVANEALRQYTVGSFIGANWYVSANIATDASDDAVGGIFTRSAIAFDSRIAPYMENERDASLRATELNLVAGYAYGLGERPTFGVKYTSDVTLPS